MRPDTLPSDVPSDNVLPFNDKLHKKDSPSLSAVGNDGQPSDELWSVEGLPADELCGPELIPESMASSSAMISFSSQIFLSCFRAPISCLTNRQNAVRSSHWQGLNDAGSKINALTSQFSKTIPEQVCNLKNHSKWSLKRIITSDQRCHQRNSNDCSSMA